MLLLMGHVVQHATHEHAVFMQVGYYHWLVIMVFFVEFILAVPKLFT